MGAKDPVFVSVGHKITLNTAIDTVLSVSVSKIPEPVRMADIKSRDKIRYLNRNFEKVKNDIKHYNMIFKKPQ